MLKVNSTNNHFTLATILLSIAIVVMSICLNLNSLSHLWLPREALPVAVAETLAYPDALTTVGFATNRTIPIILSPPQECSIPLFSQLAFLSSQQSKS
jgi:hypothetical protein